MGTSTAGLNDLDTVVKLWIRLWTLILNERRHYESVRAILQRLVYEADGWPTFKNWPEICNLSKSNPYAMMAIATMRMDIGDPIDTGLIAAFPQCFSEKKVQGPIPRSILHKEAIEEGARDDRETPHYDKPSCPDCYKVLEKYHIPCQAFRLRGVKAPDSEHLPILPDEVPDDAKQWDTVTLGDRKLVVVEIFPSQYKSVEIRLAPAECIDLTA